jgi:hypothetical protein
MTISMRPTMISPPVATQPPITEALGHGSGRVAIVALCLCCATRVPSEDCERQTIVIELPRFVIVARRVATGWLVCTI